LSIEKLAEIATESAIAEDGIGVGVARYEPMSECALVDGLGFTEGAIVGIGILANVRVKQVEIHGWKGLLDLFRNGPQRN
jgi:hypothetical protein